MAVNKPWISVVLTSGLITVLQALANFNVQMLVDWKPWLASLGALFVRATAVAAVAKFTEVH